MANFNLNIAKQVYEITFGYFQIPKFLDLDPYSETKQSTKGTDLYKIDEYGNSMFMPVTLVIGNKEDGKDPEEITLPYSTVSVSGSKKIINTELVNRKGSVNEQVMVNDNEFRINGVVVSRDEMFPESWIEKLSKLYNTQQPVEIVNAITDYYLESNQNIIIKSFNLPDMRGISHAQSFSFKAKADTNLELVIE